MIMLQFVKDTKEMQVAPPVAAPYNNLNGQPASETSA
jgi:hypothetical protein